MRDLADNPERSTPAPAALEEQAAHRDLVDDNGVRGTITIAPAVLVELIELTVQNIDGLVGIARGRRKGRGKSLEIQTVDSREHTGKTFARGGVQVRIDGSHIDADLNIIVRSGANVLALGADIQSKVAVAVERMLGMTAREINVHVVEVQPAPKDEVDA